jgi:hypothetical protein
MLMKSNIIKYNATQPNYTTFRIGLSNAFGTGTATGLLYSAQASSDNLGNNALGQQKIFKTQGGI